jgi:CRISPR-associated exonuclease Cas4
VILQKLMEELATGELAANAGEARERAHLLCQQLAADAMTGVKPDPDEMAETTLRTFALPELQPFRQRLVSEVPLYGATTTGAGELISGHADAVAPDDGDLVVFERKATLHRVDETAWPIGSNWVII